jgi:hypothetical protein
MPLTLQDDPQKKQDYNEIHRIRIVNRTDGAIQVSSDRGKTWYLIGRVLYPAQGVIEGYIAAEYAAQGSVAAIAVHGIHMRVSEKDPTLHAPLVISLQPREYAGQRKTQKKISGFGGVIPGLAGIVTDIPAGTSLFRELSPLVGDTVFVEDMVNNPIPLPSDFRPRGNGETFIIPVYRAVRQLTMIQITNKRGGKVIGTFSDGKAEELTTVQEPVRGIGRFDGTAYTGVGRINTAHTGVITVCTAPLDTSRAEGEGEEQRGGFQISPVWHNARTEEFGAPMMMTLGKPGPRTKDLEGKAPLFRDMICLATYGPVVDMQIDNGDWEPMLTLCGKRDDAFTPRGLNAYFRAQGMDRKIVQGVTGFRFRFPLLTPETSNVALERAADSYLKKRWVLARTNGFLIVNGAFTISANPKNLPGISFVRLRVDGVLKGLSNASPFNVTWDTKRVPDGDYVVETEAVDENGEILGITSRRVFVANKKIG